MHTVGLRRGVAAFIPIVAVLLFASGAWGAVYSDPAGDNCKPYNGGTIFCGEDFSGASDSVDTSGNVHLTVSGNSGNCMGNGLDEHHNASFGIQTAGATTPSYSTLQAAVYTDFGTTDYFYRVGAAKTPVTSSVTTVGGVTTYDITLPPSLTGPSFAWVVGNDCIGEQTWQASDIVPNTGLFAVTSGSTTPPPGPGPSPAPGSSPAPAPAPSPAVYGCPSTPQTAIIGGCPLNRFSVSGKPVRRHGYTTESLKVPGRGVISALQLGVTRKNPALIAKTRVSVTKAGTVRLKLKPNAAGKKVLAAKGTFSVKVMVSFTPTGGKPAKIVGRIKLIR